MFSESKPGYHSQKALANKRKHPEHINNTRQTAPVLQPER